MEYGEQARFDWLIADAHSRENVNFFRALDQLCKFRQQKEKSHKKKSDFSLGHDWLLYSSCS